MQKWIVMGYFNGILMVVNTYFKKNQKKLKLFNFGCNVMTVDYILVKKKALSSVRDVLIILSEECFHHTGCLLLLWCGELNPHQNLNY